MVTTVVHMKHADFDIYIGRRIGRDLHYGNPFSHHKHLEHAIPVDSREEAVEMFQKWLDGEVYQTVDPERRRWILLNIPHLKGKVLGCFCSPLLCHGDILAERANAS